jgi:predicted ATPase
LPGAEAGRVVVVVVTTAPEAGLPVLLAACEDAAEVGATEVGTTVAEAVVAATVEVPAWLADVATLAVPAEAVPDAKLMSASSITCI